MRTEKDSMGEMNAPDDALWGASTQRAILNFPISGRPLPEPLIRGLGLLKAVAALVNEELALLPREKSALIQSAAREVADGKLTAHFPVDVFQTGSGTSTNMNANEVIANRAAQLAKGKIAVHPNDDVNLGQSSNDVMPTAIHLSLALALRDNLRPALVTFAEILEHQRQQFDEIIKIGRTHLMDATPLTLGQEFSGYAAQARKSVQRVDRSVELLHELAIGGTAVGTGLNTHPEFGARVSATLAKETGIPFHEAANHFEAQAARDDAVEVAGILATIAASLTKIANDIRLLSSGPRAGFAELKLPATQPGSSIMPGKVNPVMSEMLVQVCLYVQGLSQTVVMAGRDGHFELNVTLPLMAHCLHESVACLSNGVRAFTEKCLTGLEADVGRCRELMERSLMLVTALNPHIGYAAAAGVAKEALASGRTLREVVLDQGLMEAAALDRALDPRSMTKPA